MNIYAQNILICVPKMNKGLAGLERHEDNFGGKTIPLRCVLPSRANKDMSLTSLRDSMSDISSFLSATFSIVSLATSF